MIEAAPDTLYIDHCLLFFCFEIVTHSINFEVPTSKWLLNLNFPIVCAPPIGEPQSPPKTTSSTVVTICTAYITNDKPTICTDLFIKSLRCVSICVSLHLPGTESVLLTRHTSAYGWSIISCVKVFSINKVTCY